MNQTITLNDLLIFSCRSGNLQLILERIQKGADINYQDNDGTTPLLTATKGGHLEVVKYLLEQGADLTCKDHYGNNPLEYAIELNKTDIAEILFNNGAYLGEKASPYAKEWLINFRRNYKKR